MRTFEWKFTEYALDGDTQHIDLIDTRLVLFAMVGRYEKLGCHCQHGNNAQDND